MKPIAFLLAALMALGSPAPAAAYLKYGVEVRGSVIDVKWSRPIPYFITERPIAEVSVAQLRDAVARAFATWAAVPTAQARAQFQGLTITPPGFQDGRTTFGFLDRPELERVLGATSILLDSSSGEIVEADVFFNTRFPWSVLAAGEQGRVDLESVALHEIGHLFGLGHSAIGETEVPPGGGRRVTASGAVMFPIAMGPGSIAERELQPDDIAGISELYPAPGFSDATGSVSGRVLRNGQGVFGAHIVAFNPATGHLVGNFSLNGAGEFAIAGLPPGAYILRVEPIDDAEPETFFVLPADTNFRVTYSQRLVVVPAGGGSDLIDIPVRPR